METREEQLQRDIDAWKSKWHREYVAHETLKKKLKEFWFFLKDLAEPRQDD